MSPEESAGLPYVPLPTEGREDGRSVRLRTRHVFDTIADAYDRARPGYPPVMFADLRRLGLAPKCRVLEVGCGTGQATRQLAATAGRVCCIELGEHLARRARENLAGLENVSVVTGDLEEVDLPPGEFDLVFSATAFHWIDPDIGFGRAAALLAPGGSLALAANAHVDGGTQMEIAEAVRELHRRYCPEVGDWTFPTATGLGASARAGGDVAHVWARVDRSFQEPADVSGLFQDPVVATYEWTESYQRDDYLVMLGTHSPYATLRADQRAQLFDGIGGLIDDHLGGAITKPYLAILAVAERA